MKFKLMVVALAATLAGALAGVAPAFADSYGGTCAVNSICLYEEINEKSPTADRWQSSLQNIINHGPTSVSANDGGGCLNLGSAVWTDGKLVDNSSASLMWYVQNTAFTGWKLSFYNWVNCNLSGPYIEGANMAPPEAPHLVNNLGSYIYPNNNPTNTNEWHTISSIYFGPA